MSSKKQRSKEMTTKTNNETVTSISKTVRAYESEFAFKKKSPTRLVRRFLLYTEKLMTSVAIFANIKTQIQHFLQFSFCHVYGKI